ncbi:hypothetical protein AL755_03020 (plasmid) [Arthrobacter sp. ERGS1:01]|uniref:hypothetical protein n=1 Tax=Arthrobacter sp. ERGS1:01 TaxID=1704044 RepID=UPI0006B67729|nr:hypothetical protein [Arthrobacter sp. ERGS1:01]ALE04617.1 hypothetical protein AL755_03020 [Arthrobacter sp. ERGS1:01]
MIKHHADLVMEITAHDPNTLENDLNTAEAIARARAMVDRQCGILVTRHNHHTYTVHVSCEVPYGQTLERRYEPGRA